MSGIWVPWRAGSTAAEQQTRRAGRPIRGQVSDREARQKAVEAHRKELFKKLKNGKISNDEYQEELRKLH